jgi:very-short-patch-repair endonuclease
MQTPFDHVTVSPARHPLTSSTIRVHRSAVLGASHVRTRKDGIRVTSPARTLFDLSGVIGNDRLESAIEHALRLGLVTVPDLWAVGRELACRGRVGSGRFVRMLHARPDHRNPVDSNLELVLERALVGAGLPKPERQFELRLRNGHKIHPDLAWPEIRLAIEVDHVEWHGGIVAIMNDHARDRQVALLGWSVERVTDGEIKTRLRSVVADLSQLHSARRQGPAA